MKKRIVIALYIILSAWLLVCPGCAGSSSPGKPLSPEKPVGDTDHGLESEKPGGGSPDHGANGITATERLVHLEPAMIRQWGIRLALPENRDYSEKISLNGVTVADDNASYLVNARMPGKVTAMKKDTGDLVKTGDVLCILDSPPWLETKTKYIKAFQSYRLTKEDYLRALNLSRIKALEKRQVSIRESEYKTAMAEFFSLHAELTAAGLSATALDAVKEAVMNDEPDKIQAFISPYFPVLSPGPGKVIGRNLKLGEQVAETKTLYEISDTRQLWVILDALEKDLPFIDRGTAVTVITGTFPGQDFPGQVLVVEERVDPQSRSVKVRVAVKNPAGRLKPEMYVTGQVGKSTKTPLPAVPSAALVKVSGIAGVFVEDGQDFAFRPVEVVEVDAANFAFVKGLIAGERVVIEGAFFLKAELEIQSGKTDAHAGHAH